ncbi:MAG: DNA-binding response OmpR family regulator [Gammaproteobacteria bacterium]|jgi:DNA-binding response OmpR family regulator
MRILLVEDNERLSEIIALGLSRAAMSVDRFATARDGAAALATVRYDAAILDLGLPDADGLDVLREARRAGVHTPIIILTARDGLKDRVLGLNSGADDYLLKPFDMEELIARVHALMRRPEGALGVTLKLGNVLFDSVGREMRIADQVICAPRRELDLLEQLLRRAGRVVSKSVLEDALYGFDDEGSSNSVEVAMHRLRKRLLGGGADVEIHTLRGVGYMMRQ